MLEFDLYHAEPLLPLSDDAVIEHLTAKYLAPVLPGGAAAASSLGFNDASVLRFRKAVTRFSPGSHEQLPGITTSIPNLFVAGDCVKQGPGTHGCKGLSQEKAYVTGLQVGGLMSSRVTRSGLLVHQAMLVLPAATGVPYVSCIVPCCGHHYWCSVSSTCDRHTVAHTWFGWVKFSSFMDCVL